MFSETHFRTLLFILAYASCVIYVTCSNAFPKDEILPSSNGNVTTNSYNANASIPLSEDHSNFNEKAVSNPVSLEGGSKVEVNREKSNNTTVVTPVQNDSLSDKNLPLDTVQSVYGDTNSSDHKPHKGRKGVDPNEMNSEEFPIEQTTLQTNKITDTGKLQMNSTNKVIAHTSTVVAPADSTTKSSYSVSALGKNKNASEEFPNQKVSVVNSTSNSNSSIGDPKYGNLQNGTIENKTSVTEIPSSSKSKPEFTRDDKDVDDHSSYSLTNPENDYVIPIVATIFAAPLLIVLGMFLYKRSKEYWERRHYRRMDFLIDGMYND